MDLVPANGESTKYAVLVKDLQKKYKQAAKRYYTVFKGVNLHLPEGTIYGLLGPSGCGKTSLLKCILGRLKATQGSILVFGHPPGTKKSGIPGPSVGYMPQETSIFETLTIAECLQYYGAITGMTRVKVNSMIDYYVELLSLPPKNTVNGRLSGGQLRRVAFAVAMIHSPKLLILDEPTVGIDCITKDKMWNHLVKVVKESKASVILTTHYIEEARSADMVGLMHNHTLAEEDYTERLLAKYNCQSLEEVFLTICCRQSYSSDDVNSNKEATQMHTEMDSSDVWVPRKSLETITVETKIVDSKFDSEETCRPCNDSTKKSVRWTIDFSELRVRWYIVSAIIMKNFIGLYRLPGALIFLMILPSFQVFVPLYVASAQLSDMNYKLLVVNEDAGYLGSRYLSHINSAVFSQEIYNSAIHGNDAIKHGNFIGIIKIHPNFTESLTHRIKASPLVNNETMDSSIIKIQMDNIHYITTRVLQFHILNSFDKFFQELGANVSDSASSTAGSRVVVFEKSALKYVSNFDGNSIIGGAMILSAYFGPIGVAIFSLFVERSKGYFERTYVAGVSSAEIMLGTMVLLLAILVPQIILLIFTYCIFKSISVVTGCVIFAILYGVGVSGIALGMFLAMAVDHLTSLLLGFGLTVTLTTAITGHIWPYEAVSFSFRQVILLSPYTYPTRAFINIIMYGFNIYRRELIGCLSVLLGNTIVFLVITWLLFKFRK